MIERNYLELYTHGNVRDCHDSGSFLGALNILEAVVKLGQKRKITGITLTAPI